MEKFINYLDECLTADESVEGELKDIFLYGLKESFKDLRDMKIFIIFNACVCIGLKDATGLNNTAIKDVGKLIEKRRKEIFTIYKVILHDIPDNYIKDIFKVLFDSMLEEHSESYWSGYLMLSPVNIRALHYFDIERFKLLLEFTQVPEDEKIN